MEILRLDNFLPPDLRNDKLSSQMLFLQDRNVSITSSGDTPLEKIAPKSSFEALGSMRPEFPSWISLKLYKILLHHTKMISQDNYLKTNKRYSTVGGQH